MAPQPGLDLDRDIADILDRFRNPVIRHRLGQIAWDGTRKLPFRLIGTPADALAARRVPAAGGGRPGGAQRRQRSQRASGRPASRIASATIPATSRAPSARKWVSSAAPSGYAGNPSAAVTCR